MEVDRTVQEMVEEERLLVGWSKNFPILGRSRDRYLVLMLDRGVHGYVHPPVQGGGDVLFLLIRLGMRS